MKITLAQLNYHIGNFGQNKELIINAINKAKDAGSDLVIFSELSVPGYPPLDLLDRLDFIDACNKCVEEIALSCQGITAIVGSPVINTNKEGKKLFNSALVLSEGKVIFRADKSLLPTYDIFDEYRYFEPGRRFSLFEMNGLKIALTICEDLWDEQPFENEFEKQRLYTISPMDELARLNPDLVINISASPFSHSKIKVKEEIFRSKAKKHNIPVITVNQTGANTELIFDGASKVIDKKGVVWKKLKWFEEEIFSFDLQDVINGINREIPDEFETEDLIQKALVTGIRDYFRKSGLTKCILGLSGGIDSALTLYLAVEALGKRNVRALLMPSRYSSEHSVKDSVILADRLDIKYDIISIENPFHALEADLHPFFRETEPDVTEENLQARIRAIILMAFSNKFGYVLLNTSNKSEAAVGYGTLYGDMSGGISVIGDLYKTDVYRLAAFINRNSEVIPSSIITKPPSAELRPGQFDSDSLPDYNILDSILYQYIELQKPIASIKGKGIEKEVVEKVIRLINFNEYKRYQAPPVLRVSSKSFGAGRRMPLVAKYLG